MHKALLHLDEIRLNFSDDNLFALKLTLAFIMFGVALEIKPEYFKNVFVKPKAAIVGYLSQIAVMPFLTFLLVIAIHDVITPSIALGMILVASCPGGNISNFLTNLSKGNTALAVSLTAISTVTAIIVTPFNFMFWGKLYIHILNKIDASSLLRPLEISPMHMFQEVFILLCIPITFGMLFAWKYPQITRKVVTPIKNISILIFIGIVVLMFSNNYEYFKDHIKYIFFLVLLQNTLALFGGYFWARLFRLSEYSRRAVTIETGIHNTGLALVLLFNTKIFPPELAIGGMAFIAAWWGIWHILSGLVIALFWSRIPARQ
jgi:BASS family bile acid:Na+ symporter